MVACSKTRHFLMKGFFGHQACVRIMQRTTTTPPAIAARLEGLARMGLLIKAASRYSRHYFRAHVLSVPSARKNGCGLAGRTFLNRPGAFDE